MYLHIRQTEMLFFLILVYVKAILMHLALSDYCLDVTAAATLELLLNMQTDYLFHIF